MLFIWTNGIIFHHPRFPWNKTNFPLLFTSIWGDLFWPPLPHPPPKKKIRDTKAFSMVQSANVITLLKRWWTTNTTPNALLNLRFLVFSWKKGGGSGSVSHWSLAPKKVTTWRILRKDLLRKAKSVWIFILDHQCFKSPATYIYLSSFTTIIISRKIQWWDGWITEKSPGQLVNYQTSTSFCWILCLFVAAMM